MQFTDSSMLWLQKGAMQYISLFIDAMFACHALDSVEILPKWWDRASALLAYFILKHFFPENSFFQAVSLTVNHYFLCLFLSTINICNCAQSKMTSIAYIEHAEIRIKTHAGIENRISAWHSGTNSLVIIATRYTVGIK